MTIEDIFELNIPKEFGLDQDYDDDIDVMYDVYDQLPSSAKTAYGASKFVIFLNEEYIIKIPFNGEFIWCEDEDYRKFYPYKTKDYCEIEASLYHDAIVAGVADCFAETKYIGKTASGASVYKSERVNEFYNDYDNKINTKSPEPSEEVKSKAACKLKYNNFSIPKEWLARAIDFYGEDLIDKLIKFIKENKINDLTIPNVGFRADGAPVILDYSGFRD